MYTRPGTGGGFNDGSSYPNPSSTRSTWPEVGSNNSILTSPLDPAPVLRAVLEPEVIFHGALLPLPEDCGMLAPEPRAHDLAPASQLVVQRLQRRARRKVDARRDLGHDVAEEAVGRLVAKAKLVVRGCPRPKCAGDTSRVKKVLAERVFDPRDRLAMTRTVNGTGHTDPSEFCATSI